MPLAKVVAGKLLVQSLYESFRQGDVAAVLAALAHDVVWKDPGPAVVPFTGTCRGPGQVAQWFDRVEETVEFQSFTFDEFIEEGDRVVVHGTYTLRSRKTGRSASAEYVHLWTVRAGKVTSFAAFGDKSEIAEVFR